MSVIKSNFSNLQLHGKRIHIHNMLLSTYLFIGRMTFSVVREICFTEVCVSYKCYVCYKIQLFQSSITWAQWVAEGPKVSSCGQRIFFYM